MKEIIKYPDGSTYACVDDFVDKPTFSNPTIVQSVRSYNELWMLGQRLEAWNNLGHKPIVKIPFLIDTQADARFSSNQSFGLKMVCDFLNQFDAIYHVYHPHNPLVLGALLNNFHSISNINFVREVIGEVSDGNLSILAPDSGAFKWVMKVTDDLGFKGNVYSASKYRVKGNITTVLNKEDFNGEDIIILDDICVYGGTFKALSKMLKERNVGKLYLAVSHMTTPHLGDDPVTKYFDQIYTTSSNYLEYTSSYGVENIVIVPI